MYRWALGLLATALLFAVACAGSTSGGPAARQPGASAPPGADSAAAGGNGQRRGGRPDPWPASAPRTSMKIGLNAFSASLLPLWVAKDAGIFDKYGFDVEFVTLQSSSQVAKVMAPARSPSRSRPRRAWSTRRWRRRPGAAQRLPELHELLGLRATRGQQRSRPPRQEGGHHAHRLRRASRRPGDASREQPATRPRRGRAPDRRHRGGVRRAGRGRNRRRHPLHSVQLPGPHRQKHDHQRDRRGQHGQADLLRPLDRRLFGAIPFSSMQWKTFSSTTIASSITTPTISTSAAS